MSTTEILTKANEIVKNANFTDLKKARKNVSLFLIVACANGLGIYGSYSNDNYYVNFANETKQLI